MGFGTGREGWGKQKCGPLFKELGVDPTVRPALESTWVTLLIGGLCFLLCLGQKKVFLLKVCD